MALGLLYVLSVQGGPKSGMAVSINRIGRDMSSGIFSPFVEQVEISPQVHCTRTIGGSLARIQTKKQVALTCVLGGSEERIGWLTWCVLFSYLRTAIGAPRRTGSTPTAKYLLISIYNFFLIKLVTLLLKIESTITNTKYSAMVIAIP